MATRGEATAPATPVLGAPGRAPVEQEAASTMGTRARAAQRVTGRPGREPLTAIAVLKITRLNVRAMAARRNGNAVDANKGPANSEAFVSC